MFDQTTAGLRSPAAGSHPIQHPQARRQLRAHARPGFAYRNVEKAVRSQYWMLAVMVAFTGFGLWLLSAVGT